ncbi:MAG: hypothetical protein LUB59_02930 [Candidatus Gastranaerophilales bacterium]|nr:hypothetical protein [Candidatus Gastranaerophilales bacterium]
MKKYIIALILAIIFGLCGYYSYTDCTGLLKAGNISVKEICELFLYIFLSGVSISALAFNIIFSNTAESLNVYKRELEKGSIDKTENSSRIKVLESKIKVLEKALDEALKNREK